MKIILNQKRESAGNTLLATLTITGLLGFLLATYMTVVQRQFAVTVRSQAWNAAVPVIEAGIEDALAHLNAHGAGNLASDDWRNVNGVYTMQRSVGENFYVVGIAIDQATSMPVITSRGYVTMRLLAAASPNHLFAQTGGNALTQNYLVRGVKVGTRMTGLFTKAMVARNKIVVSGNVMTDSYNSMDPNASTNGQYDPAKALNNGDVASNGQLIKQISTSGTVNLYGHISTGPNGTVGLSGTVSIGSKAWIDGGNRGVQDGWFRDDMNIDFPDVPAPFTGGAFTPSKATVDGKEYEYVLGNGNYQLSSIALSGKQEVLINGHAKLYVTGNINMSGQAKLKVVPGGSLRLYVAGSTASLSGQGVANETGFATNFVYYGLPTNTRVDLSGGSGFTGIIYAPGAALKVSGGSTLYGATISDTVSASGGFSFHYDESLASFEGGGYVVTSWDEMGPQEIGAMIVAMEPPAY